jgi:serine protease
MRAPLAVLLLLFPAAAALGPPPLQQGEPGAVLVGYEGDLEPLLARIAAHGAQVRHVLEGPRVLVLDAPDAAALRSIAATWPGVRHAEVDAPGSFEGAPNDLLYPWQWGLDEVKAPASWDVVGGGDLLIAVPDTGFYPHPDLTPNVWTKPSEFPPNGVDDDGNGFVDDWRGWDFGDNDNDPMPRPFNPVFSHGTAVAGVIAAVRDDHQGIAGAARFRVMDLKITDQVAVPRPQYAAAAITYAVEEGARIVVMAWKVGQSQALTDVLQWAHGRGVLLVKSAGNAPDTQVAFPGTLPEVLNVGALQEGGTVADWSVRDARVELTAPGGRIATTFFPIAFGYLPPVFVDPNLPVPGYVLVNGTSFAAPFVAAAAAQVWTLAPDLTHEEVRALLAGTADDRGVAGRDPAYGWGALDALAAVQAAQATGQTSH